MNTNQMKAVQNELEVLKAMANCGWMTTRLIARWVWDASSDHVGVNKAQLVLKRLRDRKQVIERATPVGMKAWVLTQTGAARLNADLLAQGYSRGWANHGYDLSTLHFNKQIQLVNYLIEQRNAGLAVVGKCGLRAGLLPPKYTDFDAVTVNIGSDYTKGVLIVSNRAESTQDRIARLSKVCDIALIGEPDIVKGLQKILGQQRSR